VQTQICFNVGRTREFMARVADLGCLERAWIVAGVGVDVPEQTVRPLEGVASERRAEEGSGSRWSSASSCARSPAPRDCI
jgi:hypothetical protein